MARSTSDHTIADAMTNWDIHDDSLATEGHTITDPLGSQCPADPNVEEIYTNFDAVDNCTGAGPQGGFSTVFGNLSTANATIGPFDPIFPQATMLSDGKVDAGDAPMPAAQIDVTIKDNNTLDKTDIGGVGYLFPSYKTDVDSHDGYRQRSVGQPRNGQAHNFFAPYYDQYIPATSRPSRAGSPYGAAPPSGIDGSGDPTASADSWPRASTSTGASPGPEPLRRCRPRSACSRRSSGLGDRLSPAARAASTPSRLHGREPARPTSTSCRASGCTSTTSRQPTRT